jgi:hypothetical protein
MVKKFLREQSDLHAIIPYLNDTLSRHGYPATIEYYEDFVPATIDDTNEFRLVIGRVRVIHGLAGDIYHDSLKLLIKKVDFSTDESTFNSLKSTLQRYLHEYRYINALDVLASNALANVVVGMQHDDYKTIGPIQITRKNMSGTNEVLKLYGPDFEDDAHWRLTNHDTLLDKDVNWHEMCKRNGIIRVG